MLARKYTARVEIWQETPVSDGFGGFVNERVLLRKVWAEVATTGAGGVSQRLGYRMQAFGLNDLRKAVVFKVRGKRTLINFDEKTFLRYKNKEFVIKGIEDVDMEGLEYIIYADES